MQADAIVGKVGNVENGDMYLVREPGSRSRSDETRLPESWEFGVRYDVYGSCSRANGTVLAVQKREWWRIDCPLTLDACAP